MRKHNWLILVIVGIIGAYIMRRLRLFKMDAKNLPSIGGQNVKAFMMLIRECEGTASANGYRMLFGGKLFTDMSTHPRVYFSYKDKSGKLVRTSPAGAYQITATTFDWLKKAFPTLVRDFSEASQDLYCMLILQYKTKALDDVIAGRFSLALQKCRNEWASLPTATVPQPHRSYADAVRWYTKYGGVINER